MSFEISPLNEARLLKDVPVGDTVELIFFRAKFDINEDGILEDIGGAVHAPSRKFVWLDYADILPPGVQALLPSR